MLLSRSSADRARKNPSQTSAFAYMGRTEEKRNDEREDEKRKENALKLSPEGLPAVSRLAIMAYPLTPF
tara:strand:+ start:1115 stop:1321 length:207 start_codon:yes stop_codon:yes gene_type:complete